MGRFHGGVGGLAAQPGNISFERVPASCNKRDLMNCMLGEEGVRGGVGALRTGRKEMVLSNICLNNFV